MKKILIFFIFLCLTSCSSIRNQGKETVVIDCPSVFFSSENKVYVDGDISNLDLQKINYKVSLNNYGFVGDCVSNKKNYSNYNIDLLLLAEPINPKISEVSFPIFVLLYDLDNNLIDRQYFKINDNLIFTNTSSEYILTEIIANLNIYLNTEKEVNSMIIGFVILD